MASPHLQPQPVAHADSDGTMVISVRDMKGRKLKLEVDIESTVSQLHTKISRKWKLERGTHDLLYGGKRLEGTHKITNYGIRNGAKLHLIINPRAGKEKKYSASVIQVPVMTSDHIIRLVSIDKEASVMDLKGAIADVLGYDITGQRLTHYLDGDVLRSQDQRNIDELGVSEESIICLHVIDSKPYTIFIGCPDDTPIPLDVISSDSIRTLRNRMEVKSGIPAPRIRFLLGSKLLLDSDILADRYIDRDCILQLSIIPKSYGLSQENARQIRVRLKYSGGIRDTLECSESATVWSIRETLSDRGLASIPMSHIELYDNGRSLKNNEQLRTIVSFQSRKTLEVRLTGITIFDLRIQLPNGDYLPRILTSSNTPIWKIKAEILQKYPSKIPNNPSNFEITTRGEVLDSDSSLSSLGLESSTTLDVRIREHHIINDLDAYDLSENEQDSTTGASSNKEAPVVPNAQSPDNHSFDNLSFESEESGSGRFNDEIHLFMDRSATLSDDNWKDLRPLLPEFLRWDIEYSRSCWTFTPSMDIPRSGVPLTIAGAPVIIPVEHNYPLSGAVAPPEDPLSTMIDPRAPIKIETVAAAFQEFPEAYGFYFLLNGFLQVLVPKDFNYDWAYSYRPNYFGGLKVCYIGSTMDPTASTSDHRTQRRPRNHSQSDASQSSSGQTSTTSIKLENKIEARAKSSSSKQKHTGRIGVRTIKDGKTYLTMSTHVITSSLLAKEKGPFLLRIFSGSQPSLGNNWQQGVDVLVEEIKVGRVYKSFDADPKEYPNGFKYDVSLVRLLDESKAVEVESPIPNLGWLSGSAWHRLRERPNNLHILISDQDAGARTIPSVTPSQCLIIGEGIFQNRNKLYSSKKQQSSTNRSDQFQDEELKVWKSLVSRSILYRVSPDFEIPEGNSGLALYAEGSRSDNTVGPGVIGFQSFVQRSGHVQTYEMEGSDLDARLRKGYVAFYGAFKVPRELRKDHVIL